MSKFDPKHTNIMYNFCCNFFSRSNTLSQVIENNSSAAVRIHPEGKSLVLAVLLQDTVLDLHYDTVFDSCPICSCNGNIRAKV